MKGEIFYPVSRGEMMIIRMVCLHPEFNGDCRSSKCECFNETAHACGFNPIDFIDKLCKRKTHKVNRSDHLDLI